MSTYELDNPTREELVLGAAPQLFGISFNWCLLGCLSVQLYIYAISSDKDRTGTKVLGEYNHPFTPDDHSV
ncbi:hypothetical protein PLICRDRAFT_46760 [Plicaturopsis crispa FD-325 SS-3]|uniref:Uncharacterized protein n=1 Tax=Plicaturopsis crispa FD-325 SS-3 TaxID=944288 RepID=A0A0C9SWW5_PLICR|nr:hypothetical protein PLICRDRAFT_46760 [Plicaturopsis crispa FD-325 SS-3]